MIQCELRKVEMVGRDRFKRHSTGGVDVVPIERDG